MAIKTTVGPKGRKRRSGVYVAGALSIHSKKPVGGLNEAVTTVEDYVFKRATGKFKKANQAVRRRDRALAYLEETHEFQLYRGTSAFGATKQMTGKEARDLNIGFEKKFMDDRSPQARLWRWYGIDKIPPDRREGKTYNEIMAQHLQQDLLKARAAVKLK